jgi:cytochrome c551/c552
VRRAGATPGVLGLLVAAALCVVVMLGSSAQAGQPAGDAERGRAVFASKQCAHCHVRRGERGVGPALEVLRRSQGAFELAGRLWNHAPAMFTVLAQEAIRWPQIDATEMADLMAYFKADPARDPAPDLFNGQVTLLRKGCLKCHSLRREGGGIGVDLAKPQAAYASAAAWASTMWNHTPGMAAKALELGILYPRFADDEMGNLVAFLRNATKTP